MSNNKNIKVGELNPSQLLYSYGVGAIIDLPHLSVIVGGLDDWPEDPNYVHEITEDRLLLAVKDVLGGQVQRLLSVPVLKDTGESVNPFEQESRIGVPVSTFPKWLYCPECSLLAPIDSELFELDTDFYHPERTCYRHINCPKANKPKVTPARFLVCCENGHLDDFPWVEFVHNFKETKYENINLSLYEVGISGEARDLFVKCNICGASRPLTQAFGKENREKMPLCRGRRPHLHDYDSDGCDLKLRPIMLGASNLWFPSIINAISIPDSTGKIDNLIAENWGELKTVENQEELRIWDKLGKLNAFSEFSLSQIWERISNRKEQLENNPVHDSNLLVTEWKTFTSPDLQIQTQDFSVREVNPPDRLAGLIDRVVLAEKIREVRALVGFTRIDSPGEAGDDPEEEIKTISPISRKKPGWIPAVEVRGEGIFIQFNQKALLDWLSKPAVKERDNLFFTAHRDWRKSKGAEKPELGYPGIKYVLLHTFSHVLMRQIALESGYSQASVRERIFCDFPGQITETMSGILIYTSAPDSEGTLGGLVNIGETVNFGRHVEMALENSKYCASDPSCSEHLPSFGIQNINGAACHICLYSPETSCEKGNRYLDRSLLVNTLTREDLAFFE